MEYLHQIPTLRAQEILWKRREKGWKKQENKVSKSAEQGYELINTEEANTDLHGSVPGPLSLYI